MHQHSGYPEAGNLLLSDLWPAKGACFSLKYIDNKLKQQIADKLCLEQVTRAAKVLDKAVMDVRCKGH